MTTLIRKLPALLVARALAAASLTACAGSGSSGSSSASTTAAETTASTTAGTTAAPAAEPVELIVSAAASLTDVANELATLYKETAPNVTVTYTFGASGTLQTQIEEGSPTDIFMSASPTQVKALNDKGLLLEGSAKDLLLNKLALIVPKDSTLGLTGFEDLATDKVTKVALGEPTAVPAGKYAETVFTAIGNLDAVKAKANYGSDVRQVLTWVESGEVDAGVVYLTDALTSDAVTVVAQATDAQAGKIVYPVAIVKASAHPEDAQAFIDFLSTDDAVALFEKYGFTVNS